MNLYANAKHIVFPLHHTGFIILIANGLKQGCPLAAFLFSLAIVPLVSALNRAASPFPSLSRSYLDDIAFIFHDIHKQLPIVLRIITTFSTFSGLHLNFTKCVFIPLYHTTLEEFHTLLSTLHHLGHYFLTTYAARYLGVFIGIDAHLSISCRWPLRHAQCLPNPQPPLSLDSPSVHPLPP
jgi:hypothetical protein